METKIKMGDGKPLEISGTAFFTGEDGKQVCLGGCVAKIPGGAPESFHDQFDQLTTEGYKLDLIKGEYEKPD